MSDNPKCQLPEKTYFHSVVCSIYPEQMFQIVYQSQQKQDVSAKETKDDKVESPKKSPKKKI